MSKAPPLSSPRRWLSSTSLRSSGDGLISLPASLRRAISLRALRIVARANAASLCQRLSSDNAPSTSPCQLCTCAFGAVARTPAIISGRPAATATMRKTLRRVGDASAPAKSPAPARARGFPSDMFHHGRNRLCFAAQLGGLHQRRTPRLVIIFDLAVEALKALGGDDLARGFYRP